MINQVIPAMIRALKKRIAASTTSDQRRPYYYEIAKLEELLEELKGF